jgi:hypothetical protein
MMMNHADIIALIRALKECGTTKFKFGEFQIEFSDKTQPPQVPILDFGSKPMPQTAAPQTSVEAEAERKAAQRIQEMIKTLHSSPEELADKIFPVGPSA